MLTSCRWCRRSLPSAPLQRIALCALFHKNGNAPRSSTDGWKQIVPITRAAAAPPHLGGCCEVWECEAGRALWFLCHACWGSGEAGCDVVGLLLVGGLSLEALHRSIAGRQAGGQGATGRGFVLLGMSQATPRWRSRWRAAAATPLSHQYRVTRWKK